MSSSQQLVRFLFASQHAETNGMRMRPRTYRSRRRVAGWLRVALALIALACITAPHL